MNDYRILVVDDEEDLCEILKFNLENEGYDVDTANSAEEALKMASAKFNGARFMSCNMPCIRSHNSLIGFQKCIDHCGIGLCSTN